MKRLTVRALIFSAFTLILTLNGTNTANASTVLPLEWEMLAIINQERNNAGLGPLAMDSRLFEAARFHSNDMAINDYYGHPSSDGTAWNIRVWSFGYPGSDIAEFIGAAYSESPSAAFDGWIDIPSYQEVLLDPDYKGIGVGYALRPMDLYNPYNTNEYHQ